MEKKDGEGMEEERGYPCMAALPFLLDAALALALAAP